MRARLIAADACLASSSRNPRSASSKRRSTSKVQNAAPTTASPCSRRTPASERVAESGIVAERRVRLHDLVEVVQPQRCDASGGEVARRRAVVDRHAAPGLDPVRRVPERRSQLELVAGDEVHDAGVGTELLGGAMEA